MVRHHPGGALRRQAAEPRRVSVPRELAVEQSGGEEGVFE